MNNELFKKFLADSVRDALGIKVSDRLSLSLAKAIFKAPMRFIMALDNDDAPNVEILGIGKFNVDKTKGLGQSNRYSFQCSSIIDSEINVSNGDVSKSSLQDYYNSIEEETLSKDLNYKELTKNLAFLLETSSKEDVGNICYLIRNLTHTIESLNTIRKDTPINTINTSIDTPINTPINTSIDTPIKTKETKESKESKLENILTNNEISPIPENKDSFEGFFDNNLNGDDFEGLFSHIKQNNAETGKTTPNKENSKFEPSGSLDGVFIDESNEDTQKNSQEIKEEVKKEVKEIEIKEEIKTVLDEFKHDFEFDFDG